MTDTPNPEATDNDLKDQPVHNLVSELLEDGWAPTLLFEALEALKDEPVPPNQSVDEYADMLAKKLVRGASTNDQRAMTAGCLIAVSLHRLARKAHEEDR